MLGKNRDHRGNITEFLLEDKYGNREVYPKKYLKSEMKSGRIDIINLKLTSDGKLIDDNNCKKNNECWDTWAERLMDNMIRHISANLTGVMKPTTFNDGENNDSEEAIDRYFNADPYTLINITIYRDNKTGIWVDLCYLDCSILKEFKIEQVADRKKQESLVVSELNQIEKELRKYYNK